MTANSMIHPTMKPSATPAATANATPASQIKSNQIKSNQIKFISQHKRTVNNK